MRAALIGSTGLIGTNILEKEKRINFELYNSKNISSIKNKSFDLIVIAAPSATKWRANLSPIEDLQTIFELIKNIYQTETKKMVLFSTIDVYGNNINLGLDEKTKPDIDIEPYGRNRAIFESYCRNNFKTTVVRLPALFGKYLKKNVIYDLNNNNMLDNICLESYYQWISLENINELLWSSAFSEQETINYVSEPICTRVIVENLFPQAIERCLGHNKISYNVKTCLKTHGYFVDSSKTLEELEKFILSEKK